MFKTSGRAQAGLRAAFGPLPLYFLAVLLCAFLLIRCLLAATAWRDLDPAALPATFALGLWYDLLAAAWALLPVVALHLLLPSRWRTSRGARILIASALLLTLGLLGFEAVAEWLFWREFGVRFNFIAVDYLVYTHEVIGNIRESYPMGAILAALLATAALAAGLLWRSCRRAFAAGGGFTQRARQAARWGLFVTAAWFAGGWAPAERLSNHFNAELAGNGLYGLASAFRHNEIDYDSFYAALPAEETRTLLGRLVRADAQAIERPRQIAGAGPEKRLNVILISVESLSADFLGVFGNTQRLTPNLDRLAGQSLLFRKVYATGTRTVRGLEALTLSLPPTPGQSIVKRPDNAHLFSLGSVFRRKGYDVSYVYGGYGYFDNMNAFFSGNDYRIVDRVDIPSERIPFENVWGVADEALFDQTLEESDRSYRAGRRFFTHVMTTSNHRPYTYPDGRVDIPSHSGREGGVKYTDYAIGRFIAAAQRKPWFKDTVFVIVADHCASSAGKTELPVARYHIPLLIYAPSQFRPRTVDRLTSQIDIGPTLLGLLGFTYPSRFLGRDVLHSPPEQDRAFISTYQSLGYLKNNILTVLRPKRQVQAFAVDAHDDTVPTRIDAALLREAIAYYQGAAALYKHGQYRALP